MQHKFAYNVKLTKFKRILSTATFVNEIYFMNVYNDKLIN